MIAAAVAIGLMKPDWLVDPRPYVAKSRLEARSISLTNGLISRTIETATNGATVSFENQMTGQELLRAIKPEAWLTIDGRRVAVGGLVGQPNLAFLLPEWLATMTATPNSLRLVARRTRKSIPPTMAWGGKRRVKNAVWPPKGVGVDLDFAGDAAPGVLVRVHYDLYDGAPMLGKWIEIVNRGSSAITIDSFSSEQLGLVEGESAVDPMPGWRLPNLTVVTDYSFGGMALAGGNKAVHWEPDPDYKTQVNYDLKTPCVLEVRPPIGPKRTLAPGQSLSSMRAYELIHDADDRERQGLAIRRMYRLLSPWCTENPLMLHLTSTDPVVVHRAIDQASECGFEMVIISFWSGLDMEDVSEKNLAKFKGFADYAHAKGLELGGYSLLASRRINDDEDVINPKTGKTGGAIFGQSPCLGSKWGATYFETIRTFLTRTGFDLLEHDGSYPGDLCASTKHPGHSGLEDSQWNQFQTIAEFYRWCRAKGIFLNVPDTYFLAGSNKTGMGYRESNWSLPRAQQQIHARQNLFDGTWEKTPSMGWMMVPLVEYQGGGPAATIEPLKEHLDDYRMHLTNNLAFGAQACYRGPRLYDSPETKAMVKERVAWFKKYRDILESDVIHLRRADGRRIDAILHVNPALDTPAMLVCFNPTNKPIRQKIEVPLYYAGLRHRAMVAKSDKNAKPAPLDERSVIEIEVDIEPMREAWFTFRA